MGSYSTIKELVIDAYNSEGGMPSYQRLTALVRQHFPNSRWKESHYAWYKSAIKSGRVQIGLNDSQIAEQGNCPTEQEILDTIEAIDARVSVERDLRDFLANSLEQLEPGLKLYDRGVEYRTDAGNIDIFAVDKNGVPVVIEIKAGRASDSAVGQLVGYMGCLAAEHDRLRGILVASTFDDRVICATRAVPNIQLIKYSLNFNFHPVSD